FRKEARECMIGEDYFHGVPDLVAEVLSPASRWIDRGPRKELYRRTGVRHLWLLDPEVESVEIYELDGPDYRLSLCAGAGEEFRPALFPGESVAVDQLFDTQWKRHRDRFRSRPPEPVPEWLVPPERRLGLEHLLLLGHPERRYEIWGNRAPCVLPFGSSEEARVRFGHFLEDACRWEEVPVPRPAALAADALALPFPGRHFAGATVSFGLRNVADLDAALREIARVLRPGGKLVVLDATVPRWPPLRRLYLFYFLRLLPGIGRLISPRGSAYSYLASSVVDFPQRQELLDRIAVAGFTDLAWKDLSGGIVCIHQGRIPA
ncbi:MAG: class I SAM-dependent methyltransferase, partial [Thermoanaerobaculia bacterium]